MGAVHHLVPAQDSQLSNLARSSIKVERENQNHTTICCERPLQVCHIQKLDGLPFQIIDYSMTNKYYIKFGISNRKNAGSKAMRDIMHLLDEQGYRPMPALPVSTHKIIKLIVDNGEENER